MEGKSSVPSSGRGAVEGVGDGLRSSLWGEMRMVWLTVFFQPGMHTQPNEIWVLKRTQTGRWVLEQEEGSAWRGCRSTQGKDHV